MVNFIPENYVPAFGSLVIMLGIFGTIALFLASVDRGGNKPLKQLREAERNANMQNTLPLPKELIFTIKTNVLKLDTIPFPSNTEYNLKNFERFKNSISIMENCEFVYPNNKISNIDIKSKYGPVTLQKYISLEQNYNSYLQTLTNFSKLLIENELYTNAEIILLETINLKCLSSEPYLILCDIYERTNRKSDLQKLKVKIEDADYFKNNEYARKKIVTKITDQPKI